jgi:hypothetical protein
VDNDFSKIRQLQKQNTLGNRNKIAMENAKSLVMLSVIKDTLGMYYNFKLEAIKTTSNDALVNMIRFKALHLLSQW